MNKTERSWSSSESAILTRAKELLDSGRRAVLATIVAVDGNAYRRPGAKMLIPEENGNMGSITAGCLEDEVLHLASNVLASGEPRLETFDLMKDDIWGLGIGCNGIITILLEPLSSKHTPLFQSDELREPVVVATILESGSDDVPHWCRVSFTPERASTVDRKESLPEWLHSKLEQPASRLAGTRKASIVDISGPSGEVSVFLDGIKPKPRVIVVGSNPDMKPVVELASKAGFHTTVVGYRGAVTTKERFTRADAIHSTTPAQITEAIEITDQTYIVIMTHNFIDDRITIEQLMDTNVSYIGLMGPRERFERILDAVETGNLPSRTDLENVYTPIGLDLGGGAPYQIALSIVSEILAVHNDRDPKHLHQREGAIHDRVELRTNNGH